MFFEWIGWKDYEVPKNRNLKSVSAKNKLFFSPNHVCTHIVYPLDPPLSPFEKKLNKTEPPSLTRLHGIISAAPPTKSNRLSPSYQVRRRRPSCGSGQIRCRPCTAAADTCFPALLDEDCCSPAGYGLPPPHGSLAAKSSGHQRKSSKGALSIPRARAAPSDSSSATGRRRVRQRYPRPASPHRHGGRPQPAALLLLRGGVRAEAGSGAVAVAQRQPNPSAQRDIPGANLLPLPGNK
jgi:hypothetical protein